MQNDAAGAVLEDLIETLEDGHKGFAAAAEKLQGSGHPNLARTMDEYSAQLAQNFFLIPEERLKVLHPFKVRNDHSACVR